MAQHTDILDGRLMGIYVGGTLVAVATGCGLKITHATRNSSNKDSGKWEKVLPGRIGWSMSGNAKFEFNAAYGFADLFLLITGPTSATFLISTKTTGDIEYTGTGWLVSLDADFPDSADTTYSFSVKGTDVLTKQTTS